LTKQSDIIVTDRFFCALFRKKLPPPEMCVLTTVLTRVMRVTVPIPTLASASELHSVYVGGSVVGVVDPSRHLGSLTIGCLSILMLLTPLTEFTP